MRIRIVRNFDSYEAGQVFEDWPAGMCEILIHRGLIEEEPPEQVVERAVDEPEVERAEVSAKHGKKPRKA